MRRSNSRFLTLSIPNTKETTFFDTIQAVTFTAYSSTIHPPEKGMGNPVHWLTWKLSVIQGEEKEGSMPLRFLHFRITRV